jgi:transketolase
MKSNSAKRFQKASAKMRKEFSAWLEEKMSADSKVVFITGDLGFQAFERIQEKFKDRFFNAGVAEQNMVMLAAGLAAEGFMPIVYSIAPFAVFRPYEQIRLDLGIHNLKAIIVGNGGGYGYGIMGATHHALEDIAAISCLPNFKCFIPISNEDLKQTADAAYAYAGPSYLRLGFAVGDEVPAQAEDGGIKNLAANSESPLAAPRHPVQAKLTIVALGPIATHAIKASRFATNANNGLPAACEIFSVSTVPFQISDALIASVTQTKKLLICEEHVQRGGIGESLVYQLTAQGLQFQFKHLTAAGYPSKNYGSQAFHQKESGLDVENIARVISEMMEC